MDRIGVKSLIKRLDSLKSGPFFVRGGKNGDIFKL